MLVYQRVDRTWWDLAGCSFVENSMDRWMIGRLVAGCVPLPLVSLTHLWQNWGILSCWLYHMTIGTSSWMVSSNGVSSGQSSGNHMVLPEIQVCGFMMLKHSRTLPSTLHISHLRLDMKLSAVKLAQKMMKELNDPSPKFTSRSVVDRFLDFWRMGSLMPLKRMIL